MAKTNFAKDQLKSMVERIERLNEEIDGLNGDKKEVYAEAKGHGFDTKIIKKLVAKRKKDPGQQEEEDSLLELYESALKEKDDDL